MTGKGLFSAMRTRREGSRNGSGRRRAPLTTLKMAELAPMPRARVRMAMAVEPGLLARRRKAERMSWSSANMGSPDGGAVARIYLNPQTDARNNRYRVRRARIG